MKYRIPTPEVADDIWNDKLFFSYEEDGSREELCFMAKYFDTSDCDLAKHSIALQSQKGRVPLGGGSQVERSE